MIVYVDLEHERIKRKTDLWLHSYTWRLETKYRLEAISGDHCLIVRYDQVSPALLRALHARAVVVSGCYTDFEHYTAESLAGLQAVFKEAGWPTLGFCAGQQLMAQAYGARLDAIGPLEPAEPDVYAQQAVQGHVPGMRAERGFMPVEIISAHPLLSGFGSTAVFFQAHYWELKDLPTGFTNLARSPITPYQVIAHAERPLFGTQFHPEYYDEKHPAGRRLIENFFQLANAWPLDFSEHVLPSRAGEAAPTALSSDQQMSGQPIQASEEEEIASP